MLNAVSAEHAWGSSTSAVSAVVCNRAQLRWQLCWAGRPLAAAAGLWRPTKELVGMQTAKGARTDLEAEEQAVVAALLRLQLEQV